MYLLIDTSERDRISLSLFDTVHVADTKTVEGSNRELLLFIDDFLIDTRVEKNDIEGIMVVVGEGSFTGTRIAVTIANTFAYVLQIPVLAISKKQATDPQAVIPALLEQPPGQYISATYSAPPSINTPKKKA